MFTLCDNGGCPRACWCKRFTYKNKVPDELKTRLGGYPVYDFDGPNQDYACYVRNKAREIYERDYNDTTFADEKSDERKHTDNNRESGMREDDDPDIEAEGSVSSGDSSAQDSLLQLHKCSYRRSDTKSAQKRAELEYFRPTEIGELRDATDWRILHDSITDFYRTLTEITADTYETTAPILQDPARNGFSSVRLIPAEPFERIQRPGICQDGADTNIPF